MKLEKFKDKSKSKRKVLLMSLGVIVLVCVALLLYKTFAVFNEHVEFPIMNGKVDYFGNSDVYFAFYKGDEQLGEMPQKDNEENLVFDHGECDNGASIVWDSDSWGPMVKYLTKSKTKCSLYFKEATPFVREVVKCGQEGNSATTCITDNMNLDENLKYDDFTNIRYTGANTNNYVSFNDGELWRIIGIIDGKLKIIRSTNLGNRVWNSSTSNNTWSSSSLASYLNNEYAVRNNSMVVSGSWNVGGAYYGTAKSMYSSEQGTKWTGTVGLITASDYGYAVGGSVRATCLGYSLSSYSSGSCASNDWIYSTVGSSYGWTMTPSSADSRAAFYVNSPGELQFPFVDSNLAVFPVVYLNASTRITGGNGSSGSPFTLEL